MSLSVAALQEAGGQATEEPDLAVERLVEQGLSVSKAKRLRGILSRRFNAFLRALRGDPPARV